MKAFRTSSTTRLATAAVVGVTGVALLSGCGMATRQQAAAIVNGQVIYEDEVDTTTQQLRDAGFQGTEDDVVTGLIASPLLKAQLNSAEAWKPDSQYAQIISSIPDASSQTQDFVAVLILVNAGALGPEQMQGYTSAVEEAKVTVNPKYGTFKRDPQSPLLFQLGSEDPSWVSTPRA